MRSAWSAITILIAAAVLLEAVFAGAMLSGIDWALSAHRMAAGVLIASALVAGLVSIVSLRRTQNGLRLGLTLLALAVVLFLQAAIGMQSAKGANLLWVHVPLGAALFNFAVQAVMRARGLPETAR
jgi:hypothetical protein